MLLRFEFSTENKPLSVIEADWLKMFSLQAPPPHPPKKKEEITNEHDSGVSHWHFHTCVQEFESEQLLENMQNIWQWVSEYIPQYTTPFRPLV